MYVDLNFVKNNHKPVTWFLACNKYRQHKIATTRRMNKRVATTQKITHWTLLICNALNS